MSPPTTPPSNDRDEARQRRERALSDALRNTSAVLTSTLELDEVLDRILDILSVVIPYDTANVVLIEDGFATAVHQRGYDFYGQGEWISRHAFDVAKLHVLQHMMTTRHPIFIGDVREYDEWVAFPETEWIQSYIAAPIIASGDVIGFVQLDAATPGHFMPDDAQHLKAFADQAAIAVRNARHYRASQRQNRRLSVLNQMSRIANQSLPIETLGQELAGLYIQASGGDRCFISLWDRDTGVAVPFASSDDDYHARYRESYTSPGEKTLTGAVLDAEQPMVIRGGAPGELVSDTVRERFEMVFPSRTRLVLPLMVGGEPVGALIHVYDDRESDFSVDEIEWAQNAAELIALALANAQTLATLEARVEARTAELQDAHDRVIALSFLKDEFVTNVSHELRTPIANIKLHLHLLQANPAKGEAYLDRLTRETRRLERLIEDLLTLSQMQQGGEELLLEQVDINALVAEFIADRQELAADQGVTLVMDTAADLPMIEGDTNALGQMLSSLLTNAIHYTLDGGRVIIRTRSMQQRDTSGIMIQISDSGPGVAKEDIAKIFDRFYRGQAAKDSNQPGTGLGLAISREIAQRHGGTLALGEDEELSGASFVVWLPV